MSDRPFYGFICIGKEIDFLSMRHQVPTFVLTHKRLNCRVGQRRDECFIIPEMLCEIAPGMKVVRAVRIERHFSVFVLHFLPQLIDVDCQTVRRIRAHARLPE